MSQRSHITIFMKNPFGENLPPLHAHAEDVLIGSEHDGVRMTSPTGGIRLSQIPVGTSIIINVVEGAASENSSGPREDPLKVENLADAPLVMESTAKGNTIQLPDPED